MEAERSEIPGHFHLQKFKASLGYVRQSLKKKKKKKTDKALTEKAKAPLTLFHSEITKVSTLKCCFRT